LQPDVARQTELQRALEDARAEQRILQETRRQVATIERDLAGQREQLAGVEAELARVPDMLARAQDQALETMAETERALAD